MTDNAKAPRSLILGLLDTKTRLVGDETSFVIQKLKKTPEDEVIWVNKYYYPQIEDAIRGYAKYAARAKGNKVPTSKPLLDLLDRVRDLENTIQEIGKRLSREWKQLKHDPVALAIREEFDGKTGTDY